MLAKQDSNNKSPSKFELTGGTLCLDFTNTVDNRLAEWPQELLNSYADLAAWARQARIITANEEQQLLRRATRGRQEAERVLYHAIALREAIYRIFAGLAESAPVLDADMATLNACLRQAARRIQLIRHNNSFSWQWADSGSDLDHILWPVARSAAELLTSSDLERVRQCAAQECGWLFLDHSRNRSRRWCEMRTCGNRDKVRRFYRRELGASPRS